MTRKMFPILAFLVLLVTSLACGAGELFTAPTTPTAASSAARVLPSPKPNETGVAPTATPAETAMPAPNKTPFGGRELATSIPEVEEAGSTTQHGQIPTPMSGDSTPGAPGALAMDEIMAIIASLPSVCPTDGEMQLMQGFVSQDIKPVKSGDGVPWEPCKWSIQGVGQHVFKDVLFLKGWQYTVTLEDESVVVFYGDGVTRNIKGATVRYLPSYAAVPDGLWALNPARLLA